MAKNFFLLFLNLGHPTLDGFLQEVGRLQTQDSILLGLNTPTFQEHVSTSPLCSCNVGLSPTMESFEVFQPLPNPQGWAKFSQLVAVKLLFGELGEETSAKGC